MRFHRLCRSVAALALVALAAAPPARAQPEPKPTPPGAESVAAARAHFARGVKLYEEDDFRAALIEFDRAYALAPNWGVLYNVGQSHYQLREYASSLRALERYVREGGAQIPGDRRAQVDRELEELRGRVAHVTLAANVAAAEIALDDAPVGRAPLAEPLLVGAGRHTVSARKAGYAPAVKVVDIAGGDTITIALELTEEAPPPVVVVEPPSYLPAGLSLGLGVVGVAAGGVFGVAAIGNKSALDKVCSAQKTCPGSAQGDIDAFARNGTLSTVGFGVGGAGLVLGAYLFFHERSREPGAGASAARPAGDRGTIAPWLGLGAAGVTGSF